MKNILTILILFAVFLNSSCEKVIDVKLNTEQPRLVVDAALSWTKGTDGKNQSVILSTTTNNFNKEIPKVSGATVYETNGNNRRFDFIEEPAIKGKYTCINFVPVVNETYVLTIIYNGETYKGQEKLTAVNPIERVEQRSDLGINRDEFGIKVHFKDTPNQNDFFVLSYVTPTLAFPSIEVTSDKFFEGRTTFGLFSYSKLKLYDPVNIRLNGISESYYNYFRKLASTANSGGGGPFQPAPSSAIRGNLVNQTKESNYCLGYFSISETDIATYTIK